MKNIFKTLVSFGIVVFASMFSGCTKPENVDSDYKDGIKEISNPKQDKEISFYGETITVSFSAQSSWNATIVADGGQWARVISKKGDKQMGKGSVRIVFDRNTTNAKRSAKLYVTVVGHPETLVAEFVQGFNDASELNDKLIADMHKRLTEEYLWRDSYNKLDAEGQIQKTDILYEDFLSTNLVKLGKENIEDGGVYRDYSSLRGQRYIYSYIQEVTAPTGASMTATSVPTTKGYSRFDLGLGVTMASAYDENGTRCLMVGYVYQNSPAANAKLQRGDLIIEVNGTRLNQSNYLDFQRELYYNPQGTYKIKYGRFDEETGTKIIEKTTQVTCAKYDYLPVLFAGVWANQTKSVCIGYLVLESFDSGSLDIMKQSLELFKNEQIKDLVLDLRFNPGGSVPMCRYLLSSIVGPSHYNDTFCKMTFVDGKEEVWSFGYGDKSKPDGFNQGPDLGLKNIYVICSENTGSASELVINALRGIDFPVTTIGSRTEGKNVGMVVSTHTYNGRRFEYAPITFRNRNAKDFGDFANGFNPDHIVNNQDASYNNDIDKFFPYGTGDWQIAYMADASVAIAYSLITTGKLPDFAKPKASARVIDNVNFTRLENVPFSPKMGHFGSLIYKNENE